MLNIVKKTFLHDWAFVIISLRLGLMQTHARVDLGLLLKPLFAASIYTQGPGCEVAKGEKSPHNACIILHSPSL